MRRLTVLWCALVMVLASSLAALASAPAAQAEPECREVSPVTGQCLIYVPPPPPSYDPPGGGGGGGGEPGDAICEDFLTGDEYPCIVGDWYWSYDWACYTKYAEPQPPWTDPVWSGREDGAIFWCSRGVTLSDPFPADTVARWAPSPPWGAPPDPEELARGAIETMDLHAIEIGIVPEQGADRVGLLGLPTWMWVNDVSGSTWGPITRTATSGPWSVTATAQVDRIEWDMGDGTVVTCTTPGTEYQDAYLDADSPDCGHRYTEQGRYTVSATSYWVIDWSGLGQAGTIEMDFTQDGQIVMGEVQVLSQ
ncbi:hypothetical protein MWU75_15425 [Ornithinimicrobium sp. F0845]|uniref:hypothetical protein n=1 Tax=Ornithinimicrobium sp. F0845 TaxID=2926412 RepID=UPI001FF48F7D|nr:hypothetical protein [Ornithinimicrobium sp. F0845]MCK0113538.1 hypothetical protein [Ornithinimicrobium sp. F0845]